MFPKPCWSISIKDLTTVPTHYNNTGKSVMAAGRNRLNTITLMHNHTKKGLYNKATYISSRYGLNMEFLVLISARRKLKSFYNESKANIDAKSMSMSIDEISNHISLGWLHKAGIFLIFSCCYTSWHFLNLFLLLHVQLQGDKIISLIYKH